jgi:endonuclease YncB( thermonuclease family)
MAYNALYVTSTNAWKSNWRDYAKSAGTFTKQPDALLAAQKALQKADPVNYNMGSFWTEEVAAKPAAVPAIVPEYPKTITRGTHSFSAKSAEEERQLKIFLGIDPAGLTLDEWIATKDEAAVEYWYNGWTRTWTNLGRSDLAEFVKLYRVNRLMEIERAKAPVKAWAAMSEDEKKLAVQQAFATATATDRDEMIRAIAAELSISTDEATKYYNMTSGEAVMVGPFDLLDFTIVTGLIAGASAIIYRLATRIIAKKVGTEAAEAGAKIVAESAAKQAAKLTTKEIADAAVKNPRAAGKILAAMETTEIDAVFRAMTKTAAGRLAARDVYKEMMTQATKGLISKSAALKVTGALIAVMSTVTFIEFLYEEAMQTVGMGVWVAISNKNWTQAREALANARALNQHATDVYNYFGWMSPMSWDVFRTYATATKNQLDSYEKTINAKLGPPADPSAAGKVFNITGFNANVTSGTSPDVSTLTTGEGLAPVPEHFTDVVSGITDGDTIKMQKYGTVRILGIDAPEKAATEGKTALEAVSKLAYGKAADVYVDPAQQRDAYNRIIGKVVIVGTDIGLEMLKTGNAVFYPYEGNKYLDATAYAAASHGITAKPVTGFMIRIESDPSNAKLYIDNVYVKHRTPSDEVEMKKEIKSMPHLFTPGTHTIKATKGTAKKYMEAVQTISMTDGDNGVITLVLTAPGL